MVDAGVLAALGPQGYLVNVARGSLVDQQALIEALEGGVIAGAALDVFDNEPDIDPRLPGFDNVLLTPHIGSATHETRQAMAQLTLDNLRAFFRDGSVLTPVNG
jgi:lactate dehydrogenase-like 2-hydroxyacid dehydrogenase